MAAATDLTILVDGGDNDGKTFLFRGVSARPAKAQPSIPVSLITTTSENTLHFPFFGQQESIDFEFALFNDGVDVSNGTNATTITTVNQQWQYLNETIFGDSFSAGVFVKWSLVQTDLYSASISGIITDLQLDAPGGKPSIRIGTMSFKRGRIGVV